MITPQEVATFMESDVAKKTEQKIQGDIPLTVEQRDFLDIRNFILLRLILSNAQRPAAIRNISQQSIDRAKVTNEGAVVMVGKTILNLRLFFNTSNKYSPRGIK